MDVAWNPETGRRKDGDVRTLSTKPWQKLSRRADKSNMIPEALVWICLSIGTKMIQWFGADTECIFRMKMIGLRKGNGTGKHPEEKQREGRH